MQVTKEMYLAVVRGLLEAEELLPQTRQTRPAVRRMHRALQEAEELYLAAGEERGPAALEKTAAEPVSA